MFKNSLILLMLTVLSFSACRKKDLPTPVVTNPAPDTPKGSMGFILDNVVGDKDLELNAIFLYTLPNGDQFNVSTYNYYVTNIVLITDKGARYKEPESYHLAQASDPASLLFSIPGVPAGTYTAVEFLIGVDSVRNFSGAQSGALDPEHHMIWSWSTGYIMAKMEGTSPQSTMSGNMLSFHIAGYKAPNNVVKKITITLPEPAIVTETKTPHIHLRSDLAAWFTAPGFTGFATMSSIGSEGAAANAVAENYSKMFRVTAVEN